MTWPTYLLLGPPIAILTLHTVAFTFPPSSPLAHRSAFYARVLTSWLVLVVAAAYGVVASIALLAAGYGGLSQWTTARMFKWLMWAVTGVTFLVVEGGRMEGGRRGGEEALEVRPAVFVANHQT